MLGWHFARADDEVTIYERDGRHTPTSAAYVAASMLAAQSERPEADPSIWALAQRSMKLWPMWLHELSVPFGLEGSIVVAHPSDESLLRKFERTLRRFNDSSYRILDRNDIRELEPELAERFHRGIYLQLEGWLDNRALLQSLDQAIGSIVYETPVNPHQLDADLVIDCRGTDAEDPDLRGVRGEVVRVRAPGVNLSRPIRLMHPKYRLYVAPRSGCEYVIGATQLESNSTSGVTVRSALELLSAAFTIHDGFDEAEITELNAGLRPAYPDNAPRVQWRDGVLSVNGLYRHGYLVAPAIVESVAEEVANVCAS